MAFQISDALEEDLKLFQISDDISGIQVQILPGSGAQLHSFSIPSDNGRLQVVDSYKSLADLKKMQPQFHKGSKLSPFVCRIAAGKYSFEGNSFEFRNKFNDGNAIHGILFDKPFELVNQSIQEDQASLSFQYQYNQEDPAFPFNYIITVKYSLQKGGKLFIETTVKNISATRIPLADGWHPYFNLGGRVNEWVLSFRSKKILAFNDKLIPTGLYTDTDRFYSPKQIGDEMFDHCFLLEPASAAASAVLENPANGLRLSFYPDSHYSYLQIYTPPDRQSIAIENLSAAPDCFNNGLGLILLEPRDSQSFSVGYQLDFA